MDMLAGWPAAPQFAGPNYGPAGLGKKNIVFQIFFLY